MVGYILNIFPKTYAVNSLPLISSLHRVAQRPAQSYYFDLKFKTDISTTILRSIQFSGARVHIICHGHLSIIGFAMPLYFGAKRTLILVHFVVDISYGLSTL